MSATESLSARIAAMLLDIEAISLRPHEPFTWTSGLKAPIYCDNRMTISYPDVRGRIADGFARIICERYPEVEVIAGVATGAIPHSAFVAEKLNLPMIYVRDKAKGHGKENLIEGVLRPGQKVVLIEDLISTGGSSLKAALAVRAAGAEPLAVLAIFTYQFEQAAAAFAEERVELDTLSNFSDLLDVAVAQGRIRRDDLALLQSWRKDPQHYAR